MRSKSLGSALALAAALIAAPASAQTQLVPLNTLIGGGTISAGDLTFSNFAIPNPPPPSVTVPFAVPTPMEEFGDIAVSATANPDGTVSLSFVAIDPAAGAPSPLVVGPDVGAEKFRVAVYTVTVSNPALRIHSIDQAFGAGSTITGDSALLAGLYAVEPAAAVWDQLMFDSTSAPPQVTRSTLMPSADGSGSFSGTGGTLLPGGNLATYNMASAFGFIKGRFGNPAGGSLDSVTETFALVPAGSAVPLVVPNIATVADGFATDGLIVNDSGIGEILLTDFAQDGGAVPSLASGNPAAQIVPDSVTIPQGYKIGAFQLPPATVDAPTAVTLTASYNGRTVAVGYTAAPATPLALVGIGPVLQPQPTGAAILRVMLNRETFSGATVQLTSSDPTLAPVPASVTIPAFGTFLDFNVPFQPVTVDTPVTFVAAFNGVSVSTVVTLRAPAEVVQIVKAEYVVSKANLKVEATSSNATASLKLFDGTTGASIGTMTFSGTSGTGAKFSFQGTVPQVFTLRAVSSGGGSAGVTVSQK